MNSTLIGILFIAVGISYGSLAFDAIYDRTLGYLVAHGWIKLPVPPKKPEKNLLGPKTSILFYGLSLIIIGIYILWNRKI